MVIYSVLSQLGGLNCANNSQTDITNSDGIPAMILPRVVSRKFHGFSALFTRDFAPSRLLPSTVFLGLIALSGCAAVETNQALETRKVASFNTDYSGPLHTLVVGAFENQSNYQRGIFSDGTDRLGSQAKTILKSHLQQSNRFALVDRENMKTIADEARLADIQQMLEGASIAVAGDVTEFGRRVTGETALFGILGYGKKQTAYAKVVLNLVDVRTSSIVYSAQGAGEYNLTNRQVVGFGSTASYDATLNGKVLDLAITEAVNELVEGLERGAWSSS